MSAPVSLSNEELMALIEKARSHEEAAFETLLALYSPLLDSMVAKFSALHPEEDKEDLRQEALISFYRSALHFDTAQSDVTFGLYAKECIRHALISHLRAERRRKSPALTEEDVPDLLSRNADPAARLLESEAYLALYQKIRQSLSPYENKIWWLYFSGRTAKEISLFVEKDEKSVTNAIYRIRRKLRQTIPYP